MASAPLSHSPAISTQSSVASSIRSRSRASGSSSAMRTRVRPRPARGYACAYALRHATRMAEVPAPGGTRVERNLHLNGESFGLFGELQPVRGAVQAFEAGTRVRQADARVQARAGAARRDRRRCRALRSRAPSSRMREEIWMSPRPLRGDTPCLIAFSTSGCRISRGTSASSVSESIVVADRQTILEADLFDLEVLLQELELLLKRDGRRAGSRRR